LSVFLCVVALVRVIVGILVSTSVLCGLLAAATLFKVFVAAVRPGIPRSHDVAWVSEKWRLGSSGRGGRGSEKRASELAAPLIKRGKGTPGVLDPESAVPALNSLESLGVADSWR
jgi:hypothetical protein